MIQRRNRMGLALEAGDELLVDELDGDGPAKARVDSAKDFAHAPRAKFAFNLIGSQASAGLDHSHRRIVGKLSEAIKNQLIVLAREERFDFAAQFGIGLREQRGALVGGGFPHGMIQILDSPQTIWWHEGTFYMIPPGIKLPEWPATAT